MATEVHSKEAATKTETGSTETASAILFELEGIAIEGHKASFGVLQQILNEKGIKLTFAEFVRYGLAPGVHEFPDELKEKITSKKVSADQIFEQYKAELPAYLQTRKLAINPSLAKLLQAAQNQGTVSAALSALSKENAETLVEKIHLNNYGTQLFAFPNTNDHFPRADLWLKMAKQLSKPPMACIVIANTLIGCKSALSSGMRCVVIPNEFTSHHDFSGADIILENWDDMSAKEILEILVLNPSK